ncbi:MAG: thioesterase [Actinomycetota bacterium]|nr:thioesterase [Actinomycetota bacterium]
MPVHPGPLPPAELVDFPGRGRCFETTAQVRYGDTDPHRRLRLDALTRAVQDAGNDDLADAGFDPASPWVVRRTSVWIPGAWPVLGERLSVATFCAGLGGRWGERRTTVRSARGLIEVSAVWIFLDDQARPARLPGPFVAVYGASTDGRRTSSRLHHPHAAPDAPARPWPLRASDLDVFGHVNNSALWLPVEDEMARRELVPRFAEIEYRTPVQAGDDVVLRTREGDDGLRLWLVVAGQTRASALLVP